MGMGGISIWQLLIILVIVVLLFGTKKLRGMGGDLGAAIRGFRKSVKEESAEEKGEDAETAEATEASTEDAAAKKTDDTDVAEAKKEQA